MSDRATRELADNEAIFREVNEAIERGQWPGNEDTPRAFRCECARRHCAKLVTITPQDYERIRENARRFVLLPGHEHAELERVVERTADYVVVEKVGAAGREAEATDPRS
jgi:hypothetical protein